MERKRMYVGCKTNAIGNDAQVIKNYMDTKWKMETFKHGHSPYLELKQFSNESNVPKRSATGLDFCLFKFFFPLLLLLILRNREV